MTETPEDKGHGGKYLFHERQNRYKQIFCRDSEREMIHRSKQINRHEQIYPRYLSVCEREEWTDTEQI